MAGSITPCTGAEVNITEHPTTTFDLVSLNGGFPRKDFLQQHAQRRDVPLAVTQIVETAASASVIATTRTMIPPPDGADRLTARRRLTVRRPKLAIARHQRISARKADWETFDGLFDAFWLGKRVRSRSLVSGSAAPQNDPAVKSLQEKTADAGGQAAFDQVPAGDEAGDGDHQAEGRSSSMHI